MLEFDKSVIFFPLLEINYAFVKKSGQVKLSNVREIEIFSWLGKTGLNSDLVAIYVGR